MNSANKVWQKPEMTVLVRSNPEEVVLSACKTNKILGPNAQTSGNCESSSNANCFGNVTT